MRTRLRLAVLAVLFLPAALHAQVVYVDADATGTSDGTSWADAYTDLAAAVVASEAGAEIWVAEGVYMPTDDDDRTATFQLKSGVALYGGFDGTETSRDARDWNANPTTLSGDIGTPGLKTDNAYHVVTGSGTDATAVLDGFVITAAYGDGPRPQNQGGGMYTSAGSPTVRHCIFRENEIRTSNLTAIGAGMFNTASHPVIEDVRFEQNVSEGLGGGLGNRNGSDPTLRRVVFLENEVGLTGGGMTNEQGSAPVLVDVQFIRNTAGGWTGGLDNYQASPSLYNVVFYGNTCANYGCGMTNDTNANALVVNALFVGNRKLDGGEAGAAGLQNNGSSPTLVGVTFASNTAPDGSADGLGHRGAGTVTLQNAVFWGNGDEILDETQAGGSVEISHALIQGGYAGGADILDADPQFVRPPSPGADATWGTADDDYGDLRLSTASPVLNAGDAGYLPDDLADLDGDGNTVERIPVDLAGRARIVSTAPDLGAYEGGVTVEGEPTGDVGGVSFGSIFPNPARDSVSFRFSLTAPGHVRLTVYDTLGRRVARLVDGSHRGGDHDVRLPSGDLAAGVYWVRLEAEGARQARSFTVLPS